MVISTAFQVFVRETGLLPTYLSPDDGHADTVLMMYKGISTTLVTRMDKATLETKLGECLVIYTGETHYRLARSFPEFWLEMIEEIMKYKPHLNLQVNGNPILQHHITRLMSCIPWPNEMYRRAFLKVTELISTPETVELITSQGLIPFCYLFLIGGNILRKKDAQTALNDIMKIMLAHTNNRKDHLDSGLIQLMMSAEGIAMVPPCNKAWADLIQEVVELGGDVSVKKYLGNTAVHLLLAIPPRIANPTEENISAFKRVGELLIASSPQVVNSTDIVGFTPLDVLKKKWGEGGNSQHHQMFSSLLSCLLKQQSSGVNRSEHLYHTIAASSKSELSVLTNILWASEVEELFSIMIAEEEEMVWHNPEHFNTTALHWLIDGIGELLPSPSAEVHSSYMRVFRLLASVPGFLMARDEKNATPMVYMVLRAGTITHGFGGCELFMEAFNSLMEYMVKSCDPSVKRTILSEAIKQFVGEYKMITISSERDTFFEIFKKLTSNGGRVNNETFEKYLGNDSTDREAFVGISSTGYLQHYLRLVRNMLEFAGDDWLSATQKSFTWGFENLFCYYRCSDTCRAEYQELSKMIGQRLLVCSEDTIHNLLLLCDKLENADIEALVMENIQSLHKQCSSTWLRRNALHAFSIYCQDTRLFELLGKHGRSYLCNHLDAADVHGNTAYHVANLHQNKTAIQFLEQQQNIFNQDPEHLKKFDCFGLTAAKMSLQSEFEWKDGTLLHQDPNKVDLNYFQHNFERSQQLQNQNSRDEMLEILCAGVTDVNAIYFHMKALFRELSQAVAKLTPCLSSTVKIVGSVREGAKVGRWDEFDVQFILDEISKNIDYLNIGSSKIASVHIAPENTLPDAFLTENGNLNVQFLGDTFTRHLQKALLHINWAALPCRVVETFNPWKVIYEGKGEFHGLEISVDVVPIVTVKAEVARKSLQPGRRATSSGIPDEFNPDAIFLQQQKILENPILRPLKLFLRWGRPGRLHRLVPTIADSERDIISALPPDIKHALILIKALLEVNYWSQGAQYSGAEKPITSYMVKNTVFWLIMESIQGEKADSFQKSLMPLAEKMPFLKDQLQSYQSSLDLLNDISESDIDKFTMSNRMETDIETPKESKFWSHWSSRSNSQGVKIDYEKFKNNLQSLERQRTTWEKMASLVTGVENMKTSQTKTKAECKTINKLYTVASHIEALNADLKNTCTVLLCDQISVLENSENDQYSQYRKFGRLAMFTSGIGQSLYNLGEQTVSSSEKFDVHNAQIWARKILERLIGECNSSLALPVYFVEKAYLINKWNRQAIKSYCRQILSWLK